MTSLNPAQQTHNDTTRQAVKQAKVDGPPAETMIRYVVTYPAAINPDRHTAGDDERRYFPTATAAIAFAKSLYDTPHGPHAGGYGKHSIVVERKVITTLWAGGVQYREAKSKAKA